MAYLATDKKNTKEAAIVQRHKDCFAPYLDILATQAQELATLLPSFPCKTTQAKFFPMIDFFTLVFLDEEVAVPLLKPYAEDFIAKRPYYTARDLINYISHNFLEIFDIENVVHNMENISFLRANMIIGDAFLADLNFFKYFNYGAEGIEYNTMAYYDMLKEHAKSFPVFLGSIIENFKAELNEGKYTKLATEIDKAMNKVVKEKQVAKVNEPVIQLYVKPFYEVEKAVNFLGYLDYLRQRQNLNSMNGGSTLDPIMPEVDAQEAQKLNQEVETEARNQAIAEAKKAVPLPQKPKKATKPTKKVVRKVVKKAPQQPAAPKFRVIRNDEE